MPLTVKDIQDMLQLLRHPDVSAMLSNEPFVREAMTLDSGSSASKSDPHAKAVVENVALMTKIAELQTKMWDGAG